MEGENFVKIERSLVRVSWQEWKEKEIDDLRRGKDGWNGLDTEERNITRNTE